MITDKKGNPNELTACIFNIQRYSVHDGSGIRTLVFIKGCPLSCQWCANPEGQRFFKQLALLKNKCAGDGDCRRHPCVDACPQGAILLDPTGKVMIDWRKCDHCGNCTDACLWDALSIIGEDMTVTQVVKKLERDKEFFAKSGGGLTLGGGEPLTSPEFVSALLKECYEKGINTAVETCGYAKWEILQKIALLANMVYYDIKHLDSNCHESATGVTNTLILENAKRLLSEKPEATVIRVPLIPGFNTEEKNIKAIVGFVKQHGGMMMELMPYHQYGKSKYEQIGKKYQLNDACSPKKDEVHRLRKILIDSGLTDVTGLI
jgi:pyruvate formate lyase activating enzyme